MGGRIPTYRYCIFFSEYFTNKIITIRNSFPPINPSIMLLAILVTHSGKLLHSRQSLNNLFWKFSKRLSPNHAILIPFAQNCCTKTLVFSSLQSPASSTLHWLLLLYHQTSNLLLSNPCSIKPPSTKMYWKTTVQSHTCHFVSKILEKVVLHQLLAHLQENNLCNPFQSAYRTGHSTETTLLRVVNDLLNAMDEDKISVLLLLDHSAAFDTIDH